MNVKLSKKLMLNLVNIINHLISLNFKQMNVKRKLALTLII